MGKLYHQAAVGRHGSALISAEPQNPLARRIPQAERLLRDQSARHTWTKEFWLDQFQGAGDAS